MSLWKYTAYLKPADLRAEKLVSDTYRFLWVGIPKCATRSLLTALFREPSFDYQCREVTSPLSSLCQDPQIGGYFKFAFVRNPWARVVSCYENKINGPRSGLAADIARRSPELHEGMSFEQFVEFLTQGIGGADKRADRHWLSQHLMLCDSQGDLLVDYIGKFESLEQDLADAFGRLELPPPELPHLNTRFGWTAGEEAAFDPYHYRTFYTDRTRALIENRYARDIELFGYNY